MSTTQNQSEEVNRENLESFDSEPSLKLKLPNPARPDRSSLLKNILMDKKILSTDGNSFVSNCEKKYFDEIFFGIFIAWMVKNFRNPYQGNFCFVGLNNENSLIVLPPTDKSTFYINPYGNSAYLGNIFNSLNPDSTSFCEFCHMKNMINLNLNQFEITNLPKSLNKFLTSEHTNCGSYNSTYLIDSIAKSIVKAPQLSVISGGYGIVLHCPSEIIRDICEKYLSEFNSTKELSEILDDLFVSIILIHLSLKLDIENYATNHEIRIAKASGFSNELDGVLFSKIKNRVLALEITTLFETAFDKDWNDTTAKQFPKHFGGKVRNFMNLDFLSDKFDVQLRYIYIHLKDLDDDMLKSLEYQGIKNNPNFREISLEQDFIKLKESLKSNRYNSAGIYKDFSSSFKEFKTKILKIKQFK